MQAVLAPGYSAAIADDLNQTRGHERAEQHGWSLLVASDAGAVTHQLADGASLVIGRGDDADIRIVDGSISRTHARLHVGERLEIEDTGSSNGTFVHGEQLVPGRRVDLQPGDFFEVGSIVCAVRGQKNKAARLRQLRPHGYFEVRLQDAVEAARATGAPLGIVRVRIEEDSSEFVDALMAAASPGDVVAQYAPREYELLIIGGDATGVGGRLREGWSADVGTAVFPADGSSAGELFAAACEAMRPEDEPEVEAGDLVIEDPKMRQLHTLLGRVARGGVNVLLLGETGVGKEIFAEQVHRASPRADQPLLRLNCAAFSESLLESELFGHEKGAFTGAAGRKVGLLESANGGAVFLDEVGEMALGIQAKLLRVIEAGTLRRVGGTAEVAIDVVYIAATNRDLSEEIAAGRFRSDLFFRLNGFAIDIPPLRERTAEILPLAGSFARAAAARMGETTTPTLTEAARARLLSYRWPGNIRELRNTMERAVLLSGGDPIDSDHLTLQESAAATPRGEVAQAMAGNVAAEAPAPADLSAEQQAERQRIIDALAASRGNQTKAAKELGISRRWLSTKMARYKIPRARD